MIEHNQECKIAGARVLHAISKQFLKGKGQERFRIWQEALMRNSMVIVSAGILSYDRLIEKVQDLEQYLGEHGGNESEQLDPQERLKEWLNGGEVVQ